MLKQNVLCKLVDFFAITCFFLSNSNQQQPQSVSKFVLSLYPQPFCKGFPYQVAIEDTQCTAVGGSFWAQSAKVEFLGPLGTNGINNDIQLSESVSCTSSFKTFGISTRGDCNNVDLQVRGIKKKSNQTVSTQSSRYTRDILKELEFNVSYITGYPDGVMTNKILGINGKFPGPTIVAQVGDVLQVTVNNNIQDGQNVSIHWHGIHQRNTPFEDGPSQINQCPLKNKHTQRYRFVLDHAGTYWYHSHVGSQYTEGLWGAIVVRNDPEVYAYDADIVISLSEWYHRSAKENEKYYMSPQSRGAPPYPNSLLMNGLGRYICEFATGNIFCDRTSQKRPVYHLTPGKKYRIRLINTSAWVPFTFCIDDHKLETIEVDGVDVRRTEPQDAVFIGPGQRYSFLLSPTNRKFESVLIRAQVQRDLLFSRGFNINSKPLALIPEVTGLIEYSNEESDATTVPMQTEEFDYEKFVLPQINVLSFVNESNLQPYDRQPAPTRVDQEFTVYINFAEDAKKIQRASFNGTPFVFPQGKPLLVKMLQNEPLPPSSLPLSISYMNVIQLVVNNPFFGSHPLHLHGHHFWVVGKGVEGEGNFDSRKHHLNMNAVKRDTVMVKHKSWVVIRFIADNPGLWTFHCHIDWHNLSGMALTFVEGSDVARRRIKITDEVREICKHHGLIL